MARSTDDARTGNLLYYLNEALDWTVDQSEHAIRSPVWPPHQHPSSTSRRWSLLTSLLWARGGGGGAAALPAFSTPRSAWQLALSPSRSHLVLARETQLELRASSKKEPFFETLVLCLKVEPDPSPQSRLLVWSSAGQHFALGSSTGRLSVYDIRGALVGQLEPPRTTGGEEQRRATGRGEPLCAVFLEASAGAPAGGEGGGSLTVLTLHASGVIRVASLRAQGGCTLLAQLDVVSELGVSGPLLSAAYSPAVGVLAVGMLTPQLPQSEHSASFRRGILYWRRLREHPYLKTTMMTEDDLATPSRRPFWSRVFTAASPGAVTTDGVTRLSISPDNRRMAALHLSGAVSLWSFPSGQPLWTLGGGGVAGGEDPCRFLQSPLLTERQFASTVRARVLPRQPSSHPHAIEWWGSDDIIVLRENGCLSILAAADRSSRTGDTPEWFEPFAAVTAGTEDTFFVLECESRRKRKRTVSSGDDSSAPEDDDPELDEMMDTWNGWARHYVKRIFAINDEPLRKKVRLVEQNYRLVAFKATTPEELFQRKIQDEEYGEALRLALKYGLDTDVVYQKQWHNSLMTRAAIEDFLTKISKRNWILHECLERVPDDLDSVRSLLEFGLEATDVDALVAAGPGDEGRLVRTTPARWLPAVANRAAGSALNPDEERALMVCCEREYREGVLSGAMQPGGELTLMQVELLRWRSRLLGLLDKLDAFELILGGRHRAPDRYKADDFREFRALSPVAAAVKYARDGQYDAVAVLFAHYADRLNKHRLATLWNIPETEDPRSYALLLPELAQRIDDASEVIPLVAQTDRPLDWCEMAEWYQCVESDEASVTELYSAEPVCQQFAVERLTRAQLSEWFDMRARQIDRQSRQTEFALILVTLGMERGVEGLDTLYYDLMQLDMLVYDCRIKVALTLQGYLQMPELDKMKLMMADTTEEMFIKHLSRWLLPFLTSVDKKQSGQGEELLRQYLLHVSETSLIYLEQIISHRASNSITHPWIKDSPYISRLCAEILNNCNLTDQLATAERILRFVPRGVKIDPVVESQLVFLDRALKSLKILDKYGVHQSLAFIRKNRENSETVKRLMVAAVHREFKKSGQITKATIQGMVAELQTTITEVLTSIHPKMLYKIVIEGLLLSGDEYKIGLARDLMDLDGRARPMAGPSGADSSEMLTFQESVECIINAAREYFNSAVNSSDVAIQLSNLCLQQIQRNKSELVEAEIRLISGLVFLEEAGVTILPAELRANNKRSDLLGSALRQAATLYRNIDAVLEAGISLQIAGSSVETCKGEALRLIVQAALANNDLTTAVTAARSLVRRGHKSGWEECALVGRHPDCPKNEERCQLLHFSVAYCPDEQIPEILTHSLAEDAKIALVKPDRATSALQQVITKSAKSIIHDVSGLLGTSKRAKVSSLSSSSTELVQPVFYTNSAIMNDLVELYKLHNSTSESVNLLRALQLGVSVPLDQDELISRLASEALTTDSLLAIAYLVQVNSLKAFDQVLASLPASSFNHALALTASSLRLVYLTEKKIVEEILLNPNLLVDRARNCSAKLDSQSESNAFEKRVTQFEDFVQAKRLKEISESVDLSRFMNDASYKEETILGLCMTEEDEQFQFAATLARRYRLDEWEAFMTFLEYLICDSALSIQSIDTKLRNLHILSRVRSDHSRFTDRMTRMYSVLDGCHYNTLIFFFSLFDPPSVEVAGMPATAHLTTLRKLKSAAPSLEYKQLVSREAGVTDSVRLALIIPHLNDGNVHVFAKLAGNFQLRSSAVFQAWARHVFWHGDKPNSTNPVTAEQWINRYHSCSSYLSRLSPDDIVLFMEGSVFGEGSIAVTSEGRLEILRRCLKLCRQQRESGGKHKQDSEWDAASWTVAENRLKELSAHLEFVLTSALSKLTSLGVNEEIVNAAACQLPGPNYYTDLLADMLTRGLTLREAEQYSTAVGHAEALDSGFTRALVLIAQQGREDRLTECLNEAADVLEKGSIVAALTNLFDNDELRLNLGCFLIGQLSMHLGEMEVRRLVMTHAHRMLTSWQLPVVPSIDELTTDPSSLGALMTINIPLDRLESLGDVLHTVGLVSNSADSSQLWRLWITACLAGENRVDLVLRRTGPRVSQEFARVAFQVLSDPAPAAAISLAVLCLDAASEADQTAVWIPDILALISSDNLNPDDVDRRVLYLLIQRRLVARLVSGPLYPRLITCLLEEFDTDWLEKTARDLKEAGFVLEAGHVIAEFQTLHTGFRTLDVLGRLLTRLTK